MLRPILLRYPFIMRLDDPQSRSEHFGVWKNLLSVPEIEPPNLSRLRCTLIDVLETRGFNVKDRIVNELFRP
jgi:hypothetical protein